NATSIAAMLLPALAAGVLDQEAAHGLRRRGEEVTAAVPVLRRLHVHQADVRLVHEGGGLQCLAGLLLGQLLRRQPPQLILDEGRGLLGGLRIALFNGGQDAGDVVHRQHPPDRRRRFGLYPSAKPAASTRQQTTAQRRISSSWVTSKLTAPATRRRS